MWQCRMCPNSGPDGRELGADSFMICRRCGTTDPSPQLVPQTRSKNCPEREDKTKVAEAPRADARTTEMEAYANGPEPADERRRRLLAAAGGSRMSKKTLRKKDMGGAQSVVDQATAREMREDMDDLDRETVKKRSIIRMVEAVFDQLPILDDRIKIYIRLQATRIYKASMEHDQACGHRDCLLSISARSNAVVSTCIVEKVLEQLCNAKGCGNGDASPTSTLAELAPEVAQRELATALATVKGLQLRHASANQRMQVSTAISIISQWRGKEGQVECPPVNPPPPAVLQLPRSMQGSRDFGSGKCKTPAPEDRVTEKLVERITGAARVAHTTPKVRDRALKALTYKQIVDFVVASGLPVDVAALSLLMAGAHSLKIEEPVPKFAKEIYNQHAIAESTVNEFTAMLSKLMSHTIPEGKADDDVF